MAPKNIDAQQTCVCACWMQRNFQGSNETPAITNANHTFYGNPVGLHPLTSWEGWII